MTARSEKQHDATLVAACLEGDKAAFGTLVKRHLVRVRRVAVARLVDGLHVDDVVQEAFLQAYLNLAKLREPHHFGAWVCGIATNMARMHGRARREVVAWDDVRLVSDNHVETLVEQREQLRLVYAAIDRLGSTERAAIWHVYHDGITLRETAARLDISLSAAKVRVHRGRQRLRQQLMEQKMIAVNLYDEVYLSDSPEDAPIPTKLTDYLAIRRRYLKWQRDGLLGKHDETTASPELQQFNTLAKAVFVLQQKEGGRGVPIWVGPTEFEQIAWATTGKPQPMMRPMLVDLLETLLAAGDVRIVQMAVSKLYEQIFYGTLTIETSNGQQEIDCRPSDGILLALRKAVPLLVDETVMIEAGRLPDENGHFNVIER